MTRGDKSVGVQFFLILENIAQKFLLKSPLEAARREELKSLPSDLFCSTCKVGCSRGVGEIPILAVHMT